VPKEIIGYANKKEKNIHAKKHETKKCMPKSMRKNYMRKIKEKRENKDSPYFQNQCKKRESCTKEFKIRNI
jgi:hypothetical protein